MERETRSVNKKGELELYAEDGGINEQERTSSKITSSNKVVMSTNRKSEQMVPIEQEVYLLQGNICNMEF